MNFKVYVGTYGSYNTEENKAKWFDLTDYENKAAFIEACKKIPP